MYCMYVYTQRESERTYLEEGEMVQRRCECDGGAAMVCTGGNGERQEGREGRTVNDPNRAKY